MLSDSRDWANAWRKGRIINWRLYSAEFSRGSLKLHETLKRLELRVRPDVRHGIDIGVGNLAEVQSLSDLIGWQSLQQGLNQAA